MALACGGVLAFLPAGGRAATSPASSRCSWLLFLTDRHRQRLDLPHDPGDLPHRAHARAPRAGRDGGGRRSRRQDANKEAAAVLGFSSAIGAYGGFFIPKSYGTSIALTGGPEAALYVSTSSSRSTSPASTEG
jgi:MFS transporter, NNP family, nitrate/nitrite transporter